MLSCARHMFAIAINCVQYITDIKDGKKSENIENDINMFKGEIGKYHKIIMSDTWNSDTLLINDAIIEEHKKKLNKAKEENNIKGIIEILLSLRVNALQTNPELRTNFVDELIKSDILNINEQKSNKFVIDLLNNKEYSIRSALLSIISILAAKTDGVKYLISQGEDIIKKVIQIMKGTEDGQVLQRFSIAILQKMSVKLYTGEEKDVEDINNLNKNVIVIFNKYNLIDWLTKLFQRNNSKKVHEFCMDYGSALLANILNCDATIEFLFDNVSFYKNLLENLLTLINGNISTGVLINFLMCLNHLNQDKFNMIKDECKFNDKIKEFETNYVNNKDKNDVNIKTVILLCKKFFHTKEKKGTTDKENKENLTKVSGPLIFECFKDEVC